jgi:antitoxin HicB
MNINIYPARIRKISDGLHRITLRDCPEYAELANSQEEAIEKAHKWLLEHLQLRAANGLLMTPPSDPKRGDTLISIGAANGMKVFLHNYMIVSKITQADLARRLNVKPQAVSKMLKFGHDIRIATLASYMHALGLSMRVNLAPLELPVETVSVQTSVPA